MPPPKTRSSSRRPLWCRNGYGTPQTSPQCRIAGCRELSGQTPADDYTDNVEEYNGSTQEVLRQVGYTLTINDAGLGTNFAFYLIPSKNIKYGDNINTSPTNATEYKLISGYKTDKSKLIENGIMLEENTISSLSNKNNLCDNY